MLHWSRIFIRLQRSSAVSGSILIRRVTILTIIITAVLLPGSGARAQGEFTIERVLSPPYPSNLIAARKVDVIAWIAYEAGLRNVWVAAAPEFGPRRLTAYLDDDGTDLNSLQISDDGSTVVFVRGHSPNREGWIANPTSDPGGAERAVWGMRTSGGEPWRIVEGGRPILSPDGQWILYTRGGQIYRMPVDAHELQARDRNREEPLFVTHGSNSRPVWSPDSRRIAFTSNRGDHSFIGIYDTADRTVTYLAPGVDRDSSPTWSPDGSRIAFIRRPGLSFGEQTGADGDRQRFREGIQPDERPDGLRQGTFSGGYRLSLQVAELTDGSATEFWHTAPGDTVFTAIRTITWAGAHVLFQVERNNWRHWFSVPVAGSEGEPTDLTPGEGLVEFIGLTSDGEWLYYGTNAGDIDRRHLWRTRTRGGRNRQLTEGEMIETYPAVLASGDRVALLQAGPRQPLSVALMPARGGEPEVIFPILDESFPAARHVIPVNVVLTAEDSLEFHNQLFVPPDIQPGERRPAVLFTHGGPQRQMLLGYHYRHFYHMAYAINQYLASRGYVVISVNYRSGIGYGRTFRNAPERGRRGNSEYLDVAAAGRYLQSRPDVDPDRIGLWGLSYGGILTAQGLARNSDIFAAGVDIAGVHLWGNTIDPESVSYQSSSIAAIDDWTSPVLLIHGDDDRNVAFSQTTGLVQLLRAHDIYHELIVFPDEVHDFLIHKRWLIAFNAMDDFFRRFLIEK
jgi:dipeptidyl aminopeptidase/acylaminoacyl peptidase